MTSRRFLVATALAALTVISASRTSAQKANEGYIASERLDPPLL